VLAAVVVVIALAGAGTGVWLRERATPAQASGNRLVTVSRGTVEQTVSASGTLAPAQEADLSFAVSGTVTAVSAKVGQKVRKGQSLARVDPGSLTLAVRSAKADLVAAEQQLSDAKDADSSDAAVASAKAQVASAKSGLAQARANRENATLSSTITGTVASVGIAVGDQVGSGSTGSSGNGSGADPTGSNSTSSTDSAEQIVVISPDRFVVNATVTATDVPKLDSGMQARITADGSDNQLYGTVASVGIVASSDSSGSSSFPVTIDVTGKQTGLYSGTSVTASIVVKKTTNVLTVPTAALHTSDGHTVVYQMKNGKQVSTAVVVGTSYGTSTQIKSGLKAGDQVVIENIGGFGTGQSSQGSGDRDRNFPAGGFPAGGFGGSGGGFPAGGFSGSGGGFTGGGSGGGR